VPSWFGVWSRQRWDWVRNFAMRLTGGSERVAFLIHDRDSATASPGGRIRRDQPPRRTRRSPRVPKCRGIAFTGATLIVSNRTAQRTPRAGLRYFLPAFFFALWPYFFVASAMHRARLFFGCFLHFVSALLSNWARVGGFDSSCFFLPASSSRCFLIAAIWAFNSSSCFFASSPTCLACSSAFLRPSSCFFRVASSSGEFPPVSWLLLRAV
jgi:hypothetical protein